MDQKTIIIDTPTFYVPDATIPISICMCHDDGEDIKQLTSGEFMDIRPTSSPDMNFVVFISKRSREWKLWELDLCSDQGPNMIDADYTWAMRPWYSRDRVGAPGIWKFPLNSDEPDEIVRFSVGQKRRQTRIF